MSLDITCLFRHSTYSIQTDKTLSSLFFILKQREWRCKFTARGFNSPKTSSGTFLVWGRMELWRMYNYIPRFRGSLNSGWRSSNRSYQSGWGWLAGSEVKLLKFRLTRDSIFGWTWILMICLSLKVVSNYIYRIQLNKNPAEIFGSSPLSSLAASWW